MKSLNFKIVLFGLLALMLAACNTEPQIIEVTVEVEVEKEKEVQVEVEVTREVQVEIEGEEVIVEVVIEPTAVPIPQGGDVVESAFADINTLNPVLGNDNASAINYNRLFLGLLKLEEFTGRVIGDVAEDWTVSPDGLTYTFNLRDNISWSDGRPLTADDIVFTYDAINTDSVASPRRSGFDTVESWTAIDDYTLEVQLKSLDCSVTTNGLGTGILPAHVYNDDPATITDNTENLAPTVVSGPFTFVEHVPDDHVTLAANEEYYKGQPNIDTWTYKVYADQSSELAGFLAGETTWMTAAPQFVSVVEAEIASGRPIQMRKWFTNGYTFVGYNLANPENPQNGWDDLDGDGAYTDGEPPLAQDPHPILGDKLVRQAINTSVDYTGIINKVIFGQGGPIVANVWPSIEWAYNTDITPYTQDLEAAGALLDEAGWTRNGDEGVRTNADGEELTLRLMTNAGNEARENIGVLMKDTLDGVGFNIELDYKEFGTVVQELLGQTYDMLIIGFGGGAPEPDDSSQFSFKNDEVGAGFNFVSFYNETFESNLDAGKAVPGCAEADRAPFYKENQEIFYDEAPYAMLHVALTNGVWSNELQNFDPNPWDTYYNIEGWYLAP